MTEYTVYKGEEGGTVVYIGTTTQRPRDRFRWHKHNGKDLEFSVIPATHRLKRCWPRSVD